MLETSPTHGLARGAISSVEEIVHEARNGRMFILVDDEDRENEGDLVIPAQMATPAAINFMATHGRGLICLAMTQTRVAELGLSAMSRHNGTRHETAFTTSIEARDGVTTGISAADRARTISVAVDGANGPEAIVTPGHVFPLAARAGGVLVRAGHTEAAVDISRLAGLNASGVICEIMNDDGTMARMDDLVGFAQRHALKIGTIRDLIAYRHRHDNIVERENGTAFELESGNMWQATSYRNTIDDLRHLVLQKGTVSADTPVLVRMHRLSMLDDVFGRSGPRNHLLQRAMAAIEAAGSGIVVLIRTSMDREFDTMLNVSRPEDMDFRSYGVGAQILGDLGVHRMTLLTNRHRNMVAIEGWDIEIVGEQAIP